MHRDVRAVFAIATVLLVASTFTALAEPRTYPAKNFPEDVPCEAFQRDADGTWRLRAGFVVDTGPFKITVWSRTRNTDDGKRMEARCGGG